MDIEQIQNIFGVPEVVYVSSLLNKIFIVSVLKFGEFCDFAEENGVKAYA